MRSLVLSQVLIPELMGRGRGKGKKLTVVRSHEDTGNGVEEVLPTYKRRGRPLRRLNDEIDEDDTEKVEEDDEKGADNGKYTAPKKEVDSSVENGKKRRRYSQVNENSDSVLHEDDAEASFKNEESTSSNRFRQNGNRRKSKPRRAAEAGVECK